MDKYMSLKKQEQKAVRQSYIREGAFVDLLNQEMRELQESQKQIEELRDLLYGFWNSNIVIGDKYKVIAKALCDIGYRKIHENSVVLTEEEYERWQGQTLNIKKVRKETAEKFAERLKAKFDKSREYYVIDTGTAWGEGQIGGLINDKIDEIAKEITEGKQ